MQIANKISTIFQDYKSVVFKQLPGSLKRLALSAIRFNLNIYIKFAKETNSSHNLEYARRRVRG